jgi:hypothetical protein
MSVVKGDKRINMIIRIIRSEIARRWRGLCPAVDCSGLIMMMMKGLKELASGMDCIQTARGDKLTT